MRKYETMIVLHPDLPEAQIRETIDRAKKLLEGMGAEIQGIDEWGMRDLAYPIRKVQRGYYLVTEYSAEPEAVNELERTLKLAEEVLRFLTVVRSNVRRRAQTIKKKKVGSAQPAPTPEPSPAQVQSAESSPEPAVPETAAGGSEAETAAEGETAAADAVVQEEQS